MIEHVVCDRHERVFLAIHLTILLNEGQTVDVRVNHNSQIVAAISHLVHDAAEVFLQRFRIVSKVACALTIEKLILHAQRIQQMGKDKTANRVDAVNTYLEMSLADSFRVNEVKLQH